ncbi:MAG: PD40 domain-containing protein, partial [Clostridia bacterium]|nr:PD40 domain-containing protein [Deltaproteobacteria bacterium]
SPDGRFVYFQSDRSGIFDLYALEVTSGEVKQLTRVLGGAFEATPSPDGTSLVYRSYGSEGFDLARLSLGDVASLPAAPADSRPIATPAQHARLEVYPSKPYSPWPSIRPRAWLPILSQDPLGDAVGVEVAGQDALDRHAFDLQYTYGTKSTVNSFYFTYRNQAFRPGFNVSVSRGLGFASVPVQRFNGANQYVEEIQYYGTLSSSYPIFRRLNDVISIGGAYNVRYRKPFAAGLALLDPNSLPDYGFFNSVSASITYSNTRSYIGSISPQDGISVSVGGRFERPWLGSQFSSQLATLDFDGYLTNPLLARHVFNLSFFAGYGTSTYDNRRLFSIAGLPSRNLILDVLSGRFTSAQALRGFPLTPFSGNLLINGHFEYRFPLWDVQRGVDTLPIFIRTLSLAPFVDGAAIGDDWNDLSGGQHYSTGAEARLGLSLGYSITTTLRFGYGHGLGRDSNLDNYFILLSSNY